MIAEPPSALALFFRRIMDAREARNRLRHSVGTVDGGKLVAELEQRALPAPKERPMQGTALSPSPSPSPPPVLPRRDILQMPDRDALRVVVPDYDHLQYGD